MADEKKPTNPTDELTARIATAVASAVADATVKVQERINPTEARSASKTSPFNPEGLAVRPKLRARYIFCGAEMDTKFLTNAEVELLNKVQKPGDFHNGKWHVRLRRDDSGKETVFIDLPVKSIDQRMEIPNSLVAILNEILAETAAQAKSSAA